MRPRVSDYAHVHATDIDVARSLDTKEFDKIVNVCVARATKTLAKPTGGYTQLQCNHIGDIFNSMSSTHRTIRRLLDHHGPIDPETVDTLPLARLQLEGVYAVSLMLEGPEYVTAYMQDYWRKKYVRFLLNRKETELLPRCREVLYSPDGMAQLILH